MKLTALAVLSLVAGAWGYSAGAPEGVCDDMVPKHPVDPQKTPFPYTVTPNKKDIKAGEEVKLSVTGKPFKGLLIQVRDGNKKAVGSFLVEDDDKYYKTINCHGNKKSGVTHKNSTDKKDVTLVWKAPQIAGTYTIYTTIALDGGTFWTAKPSGTINVK